MGRETIVEVKNKNNKEDILFEEFTCGRDEATNFLAYYLEDNGKDGRELIVSKKDMIECTENDDKLQYVLSELKEYVSKWEKEIDRKRERIYDLREARRHVPTVKAFLDFSDEIEAEVTELEDMKFSRAKSIYDDLIKAKDLLMKNSDDYELSLIVSD